jgi:hypothetical protein
MLETLSLGSLLFQNEQDSNKLEIEIDENSPEFFIKYNEKIN